MKLNRTFRLFEPIPMIILLAVALPFLVIGVSEVHKTQTEVKQYAMATGTVIGNDYLSRTDARNNAKTYWSYHPMVRFRSETGSEISFTDGTGSYPAEYAVGDTVEVYYDPENPQDARIYRWTNLWYSPLLFIVIGLLPILGLLGWTIGREVRATRQVQAARQASWR